MLVFTFFERLGDIIRNRTPRDGRRLFFNLIPSMVYTLMPLGVLVAVLVTFGVFNRSSELTAMKATGISIYRVIVPVLVIAGFSPSVCSCLTKAICRARTAARRPC